MQGGKFRSRAPMKEVRHCGAQARGSLGLLASESPEVEQLGRVVELDSDMVDITQEPVPDSVLEESVPEDQEPVSASTQIASSLGINPHVLQVTS